MIRPRLALGIAVMSFIVLALPTAAAGQSSRTYVSANGSDTNSCSRLSPCATFQRAHDQALPRGEVNAIDDGNFSSVVITKPITIDGHGHTASVTPFLSGVTVNLTDPTGKVTLRDIRINGGANYGVTGVEIRQAGAVVVDNLRIYGFSQQGILSTVNHTGRARLIVKRSYIHDNAVAGILARPGANGTVRAAVRGTDVDDNGSGIVVDTAANGGRASIHVVRSAITESGMSPDGPGFALHSTGERGFIAASDNEIHDNKYAFRAENGGQIVSAGDNYVFANFFTSRPSSTVGKM